MTNILAARFAPGFAALAVLAGCGGGSSPAPAPAPAPAPPPVNAASFEPADGATKVDIRPGVRIVFDGALDAASVTNAHVTLTTTGFTLASSAVYDDATHAITVTVPTLNHDASYTLSISGLTDASGRAVAEAHATFSTWVNAVRLVTFIGPNWAYDHETLALDAGGRATRGTFYDAAGKIVQAQAWDYVDGRRSTITSIAGAGPDGAWFTADDVLIGNRTYGYDAHGALASERTVAVPGPSSSGEPDTLKTWQYDDQGNVVVLTETDGGADLVLGTADDVATFTSTTPASAGASTVSFVSHGPGPDGTLFTTDDIESATITADLSGSPTRRSTTYSAPGGDGSWTTAGDNAVKSIHDQVLDAHGNVVRDVFYEDHPNTAVVDHYVVYVFDAHDNVVRSTWYGNAGPDGVWFTADDAPAVTYDYDTTH